MRILIVLAWGIAFSTRAVAAQTDEQSVDQLFAAYESAGSPGCSLGVIRDGVFIYSKAYGLASLELAVPLAPSSVFYMASVSKQFTAASIVLAAEQGLLSLDDDIHKYFPELPDYGQPITLRQMLHHTSGFRDYLGLLQLSGRNIEDVHTTAEVIDLISRQKALNYTPGSEYVYSNTNYFLLAQVIKRATQKPLSVFAEENIFRPLGMSHTRFYDDRSVVVPGRVAAYGSGKNGGFSVDWSSNFDGVGDGGLMSSVDDLLLWDRNFYENKLGKGTLVKELLTRGVLSNGKQIDYALGLQVSNYRGLPTVEHGGALFGYRTEILRFPEQRFSVICLCNLSGANTGGLSRGVADIYLKAALQPARVTKNGEVKSAAPEADVLGKYQNPRDHSEVLFSVAGDTLLVDGLNLKHVGAHKYDTPYGQSIVFESVNGTMKATVRDGDNIWFEGMKLKPLHLREDALTEFAGEYTSAELVATYKLTVENGNLMLHYGWNPELKLEPLVLDEFAMGEQLGTAVFHRDAKHHISSLSAYSGRIRDVKFERVH